MGDLRMFFPGGNTCKGFHSFYDYILSPDATRLFIIKGGPGTGKSTFMKALGNEFLDLGYNLEFHWCSSDNNSLDAVVLPDFQIALLDGTFPHIVEPKYPGVVDQIINLGDYWDEAALIKAKKPIISLHQIITRYFRLAYFRLKEARSILNEWEEFYSDTIPETVIRQMVRSIRNQIGLSMSRKSLTPGFHRHIFAAAITPGGIITHVDTLLDKDFKILGLQGEPGTGIPAILASLMWWAKEEGLAAEIYHSPFDPAYLEMIIIREVKTAVIDLSGTVVDYASFLKEFPGMELYDLNQLTDRIKLTRFTGEIEDTSDRFRIALQGAIGFINLARQNHDELERYYIPAMDFARIESQREKVKNLILGS